MEHKKITSVEIDLSQWASGAPGQSLGAFPAVNFFEDDASFHLVAELAGVMPGNVTVTVCDETLVIRGDRPLSVVESSAGELRTHSLEIDYGPFCREVHIPKTVEPDAINAKFSHGLLHIHLPKKR